MSVTMSIRQSGGDVLYKKNESLLAAAHFHPLHLLSPSGYNKDTGNVK